MSRLTEILQLFQDVFSLLPVATVIDSKVLIVHRGISDETDLDFLNSIERHKVHRTNIYTLPHFNTSYNIDVYSS